MCSCGILASIWSSITGQGSQADVSDLGGAFFMVVQLLLSGGYEDSIEKVNQRVLMCVIMAVGVTLISILIGLITDAVNQYMQSMTNGSTKVIEKHHTLILGWNESTTRTVCQIAFLRNIFLKQNRSWYRTIFWWKRAKPSSPVATAKIVVMSDTMDKAVMENMIRAAFGERRVDPTLTRIGEEVIFRRGDPTNAHDLVRASAQSARSILVMMTEVDKSEQPEGASANSATIRTILALRNVIYSDGNAAKTFDNQLRVVVQLSEACQFMQAAAIVSPRGRSCLFPMDLQMSINTLLFVCAAKPGLSRVLMSLYNFEGVAIRCREARQLRGGPFNTLGWFVGKSMRDAIHHHHWTDGVVIGVADNLFGISVKPTGKNQQMDNRHGGGIVNNPKRRIAATDSLIFVSPTSSPTCQPLREEGCCSPADERMDYETGVPTVWACHLLLLLCKSCE